MSKKESGSIWDNCKGDTAEITDVDSKSPYTGNNAHGWDKQTDDERRARFRTGSEHMHPVHPKIHGYNRFRVPKKAKALTELMELNKQVDLNPQVVDEASEEEPDFDKAIANGMTPLVRFPYIFSTYPTNQTSFLLQFMLPQHIKNLQQLYAELARTGGTIDLTIDGSVFKKHYKDELHFSANADHFTPEEIYLANVNSSTVNMSLYGELVCKNAKGVPSSFTRCDTINTYNDTLGFLIPGKSKDKVKEEEKLIWDIDPDIAESVPYHRWKMMDVDDMQKCMEACIQPDNLYYHINAPDPKAGLALDEAMHFFILGHLKGWLEQAKQDDQYRDWTFDTLYTSPEKGHKWRIPKKMALDSIDQLRKMLGQANTWSFHHPLTLRLSAVTANQAAGQKDLITTYATQGTVNKLHNPDVSTFCVSLRVYGTFHIGMPQDKPHVSNKFMVGNFPHDIPRFTQQMSQVSLSDSQLPVSRTAGSSMSSAVSRRYRHLNE